MIFYFIGVLISIITVVLLVINYKNFIGIFDKMEKFDIKISGKEFLIIGFTIMKMFNINVNPKKNDVNYTLYISVYGEQLYKLVLGITTAAKISFIYMAVLSFILFVGIKLIVAMGLCLLWLFLAFNVDYSIKGIKKNRTEIIDLQFANMISKFTLLLNAGVTLREVIELVASTDNKLIYRELGRVKEDLENGINIEVAMSKFSLRCQTNAIKKFTSAIIQNSQKGNSELVGILISLVTESWNEKKNIVQQKAQSASQKLLLPSGLIFLGIMIIILGPMLSNLGG